VTNRPSPDTDGCELPLVPTAAATDGTPGADWPTKTAGRADALMLLALNTNPAQSAPDTAATQRRRPLRSTTLLLTPSSCLLEFFHATDRLGRRGRRSCADRDHKTPFEFGHETVK